MSELPLPCLMDDGLPPSRSLDVRVLHALFDCASVGIIVCDESGRLTAVNSAFSAMLGYDCCVLVGQMLTSLAEPSDGDPLAGSVPPPEGAAASWLPQSFEHRFIHKDGTHLRCLVRPGQLTDKDGRVEARYAIVEDVTSEREREEALERSEARLSSIVEGAVDAIVTCNSRGIILSANPATNRLFGYSEGQLIGHNVSLLMPTHDATQHGQYINHYLETGERRKLGIGRELMARRADGSEFPVWISLSEIRLTGFHIFVAILHDISPIKAAERALTEARDAAQLANRAKAAFLSNISHELRTPLNGIIGFADVLLSQMLGEIGNSAYLSYVAEIKRSGELLLTNISDILEIASLEGGTAELEETLIDFRDIAVSVIRLISKRAQQAQLSIEIDLLEEIPPLHADPRALKQALLYLLSNAVKFTPEGGSIGLSARRDTDDGLVVRVSDTGIGIAADRMEHIFEPFVQGDLSMSRDYEGVGLGLTLARALVERHGGHVSLQSVENQGTTVALHLPASRFVGSW